MASTAKQSRQANDFSPDKTFVVIYYRSLRLRQNLPQAGSEDIRFGRAFSCRFGSCHFYYSERAAQFRQKNFVLRAHKDLE